MKDQNEIVNLDQFRNRKQQEKKRKTERVFFHQLVGVYGLVTPGKMVALDLIDISEEGLGIQVPYQSEKNHLTESKGVPIRLYFSADSFMEVVVDIVNTRPTIENGVRYLRYGCSVHQEHRSFQAWKQFVNFIRAFSDISEKDEGNIGIG